MDNHPFIIYKNQNKLSWYQMRQKAGVSYGTFSKIMKYSSSKSALKMSIGTYLAIKKHLGIDLIAELNLNDKV